MPSRRELQPDYYLSMTHLEKNGHTQGPLVALKAKAANHILGLCNCAGSYTDDAIIHMMKHKDSTSSYV
jgi:hypothetical protein